MSTDNSDEALGDLLDELSNVDDQSDNAELNATTITDNNGDRIELAPKVRIRLVPSTKKDLNRNDVIRVVKRHDEKVILIKRKPTNTYSRYTKKERDSHAPFGIATYQAG